MVKYSLEYSVLGTGQESEERANYICAHRKCVILLLRWHLFGIHAGEVDIGCSNMISVRIYRDFFRICKD